MGEADAYADASLPEAERQADAHADASLPWPRFDEGPVGQVGHQTGSNRISQNIGPLFSKVIVATDAMIESALLPIDRMEITDLTLEGSHHHADTRTGGNTCEDMDVIWHGQEQQRRPTARGAQMLG